MIRRAGCGISDRSVARFKLLTPPVLIGALAISCFLLSASDRWLRAFGLAEFRRLNLFSVGWAFIGSGGLLLGYVVSALYPEMRSKVERVNRSRAIRKRLDKLTPYEKRVFRGYVYGKTRTQYFDVTDAAVFGLVKEGLLFLTRARVCLSIRCQHRTRGMGLP